MTLDHERLDVYRVSLDFAACSYQVAKQLSSVDRHARDQLLRASQSIALNIAEGCGKFPSPERRRFLQIACGSARECGAVLDILFRCQVISEVECKAGKDLLARIVAMLTRMVTPRDQVREEEAVYGYVYEYVYGEEGEVRTTASSGRAERRAAEARRSASIGRWRTTSVFGIIVGEVADGERVDSRTTWV